jgi:hypothetical protein
MQFTEVSDEEVEKMQFESGRGRGGKNPYGELLEAMKSGKKMRVNLAEGQQMKNLKWGLSQAAKREGVKLDIKVLADKSGVVVSVPAEVQPPQAEAGAPDPDAQTSGNRSRK